MKCQICKNEVPKHELPADKKEGVFCDKCVRDNQTMPLRK